MSLAGCATNEPRREAQLAWDGHVALARPSVCDELYAQTDYLIWREMKDANTSVESRKRVNDQLNQLIGPQLRDVTNSASRCWRSSYENHQGLPRPKDENGNLRDPAPSYDLMIAEFDDQGERADVSVAQVNFEKSQVALIESQLAAMLDEEVTKGGGLDIIVFTYGWHGSAAATDDYSVWFKAILEQTAEFEVTSRRAVCKGSRQSLGKAAESQEHEKLEARAESYSCEPGGSPAGIVFANRRTVGIEIAWRGDSEVIPLLTWANFWDRKGAAGTVAQGAIHDLMARLHKFYIAHSCHGRDVSRTPSDEACDTVHMLTVGHSFGALIDWYALNDGLSTGLLGDSKTRAYGYGDLTVLLNPAFEGEREKTLFDAAIHHARYPERLVDADRGRSSDTMRWPSGAQMPTLVTLQSRGDWATHYAFPVARFFSGLFENTPGAGEYGRSLRAPGWIDSYQTHALKPGPTGGKDDCDLSGHHPAWFCPFDLDNEGAKPNPLTLKWNGAVDVPAYLPLWTVSVDTSIMRDHDDISNPAIVRFIAQLFRAAYEQEDLIHERRRN
jgi:hypothetical protein